MRLIRGSGIWSLSKTNIALKKKKEKKKRKEKKREQVGIYVNITQI